jgi:hypothetical protein
MGYAGGAVARMTGGRGRQVELVGGGRELVVDGGNAGAYVEAVWRTLLHRAVAPQLAALRAGFDEVRPDYVNEHGAAHSKLIAKPERRAIPLCQTKFIAALRAGVDEVRPGPPRPPHSTRLAVAREGLRRGGCDGGARRARRAGCRRTGRSSLGHAVLRRGGAGLLRVAGGRGVAWCGCNGAARGRCSAWGTWGC